LVNLCRYETWRKHRLAGPRFGTRLKRFAFTTVLPVALALYAAQRGIDVKQVRACGEFHLWLLGCMQLVWHSAGFDNLWKDTEFG
jgi:hypothetical protein